MYYMKKQIPDKIYLQVDAGEDGEISDSSGVTWCVDRINDSDIEYVRAKMMTISEFVKQVEARAEEKMLITHKLEGAHYAAMKEVEKEYEERL